jgi:hypothetical protein
MIEIGPDENDSRSSSRGFDADANRYPMVQPHARSRYRPLDRGLKPQGLSPPCSAFITTRRRAKTSLLAQKICFE